MEKEITLVLNYLDKIGEKLGIGANMLWPYLMKQVYMEGLINLVVMVIFLMIALCGWNVYSRCPERHNDRWGDITYFKIWVVIISGAFSGIAFIRFVFSGIFQLANTEYKAFETLMEMLQKIK